MKRPLIKRHVIITTILLIFVLNLPAGNFVSLAQEEPPPTTPLVVGQTANLVGWLSIIHGDPVPGSDAPPQTIISLTDDQGKAITLLSINYNTALAFFGARVQVTGRVTAQQVLQDASVPSITVQNINRVDANGIMIGSNSSDTVIAAVSGSQPWVNILCKFSDIATEPATPAQINSLFSSAYPGVDHFWRQISYDNMNIAGTTTVSHWYALPHPRAFYFTASGSANLGLLFDDCAGVADLDIDFTQYVGINMMFNADLDCCAWGGGVIRTLDGQTRVIRTTWLPPWAQTQDVLAHEMGHGFGLPHSSGPADHPPSGLNIYISEWDVMSMSGGTCVVWQADFGCIAPGTIAYHLDISGWIPANRKITVPAGAAASVVLERLGQPQSATNPLMVEIPITSTRFYTVEVRDTAGGYDQNVPARAVIIHDVDINRTGNTGPALVVDAADGNDNVNDAGAQWLPGEVYRDTLNNITISVISAGTTSFRVNIGNKVGPPPNDDFNLATNMGSTNYSQTLNSELFATSAVDDPIFPCTGSKGYYSVWYKITPTVSGSLTVTTANSDYDTVLGIWTGSRGSLQNQGCNNDFSGLQSQAEVFISPGTTYYVEVAGLANSSYGTLRISTSFVGLNATPARNLFVTHTPTLTWNRVTGAEGYQIQVDNNSNFSSPEYNSSTLEPLTLSHTVPVTLANGTWYWRARAYGGGVWGSWSASDVFVINAP